VCSFLHAARNSFDAQAAQRLAPAWAQAAVAQRFGGGAIGDALEARDEEILRGPQRLDLDRAAVGGRERAVVGDRGRIGRERPQLDLAAHAVRGAQPGDADALLGRARRHRSALYPGP